MTHGMSDAEYRFLMLARREWHSFPEFGSKFGRVASASYVRRNLVRKGLIEGFDDWHAPPRLTDKARAALREVNNE